MDRIPSPPADSRSHANAVPYLGLASKYDRLGFNGFPERGGMEMDDFIEFSRTSPDDTKRYERADIPI